VGPASVAVQPAGWRRALPCAVAAMLAVAAVAVLLLWAPWRSAPPIAPVRLSAEIGAEASLVTDQGAAAVLSPDGRLLVFAAQKTGTAESQLFVRRLEQLQASALAGTDGARNPFFSPDGQWVAFFAGGKLKKLAVTGGAPVTLCDAPSGRGGSWAEDDTITFTPGNLAGVNLLRVSSAGGKPEPLAALDQGEASQRWPQVLPGGKAVLYTTSGIYNAYQNANLVVQTLPTGPRKIVQRGGWYGRYLPSGHLVYVHEGTLFAAPFDLSRLEVTGQAVPVLEDVTGSLSTGGAQFAVAGNGTLVYLPGGSLGVGAAPIVWMDREGKTSALRTTLANWSNPRFAPDGQRIAVSINDGHQSDVWVYDWTRDTLSRLTFDPADDVLPAWTPDGRRVVFASARGDKATLNLYWQRADGTGEVQRLTESKNNQSPTSWHPSGKYLAFHEANPQTSRDVMILPMEGDEASGWKPGKPTAFLSSPFNEAWPAFSPDGRWLAYSSNESGRDEVYVRPFPGPGGKWQISASGGTLPAWSRARHELFYEALQPDNRVMVASYTTEGDSFRADKPRVWADRQFGLRSVGWDFDLHPDGNRVAIAPAPEAQTATKQDKVVFIFNFFDELRRLAPTARK
jgi:Tol biopolymer transport system component